MMLVNWKQNETPKIAFFRWKQYKRPVIKVIWRQTCSFVRLRFSLLGRLRDMLMYQCLRLRFWRYKGLCLKRRKHFSFEVSFIDDQSDIFGGLLWNLFSIFCRTKLIISKFLIVKRQLCGLWRTTNTVQYVTQFPAGTNIRPFEKKWKRPR